MPDRDKAWPLLERQALDLRERAELFRTAAEGLKSRTARDALLELAQQTDRLAATVEAQIRVLRKSA
ncbi:MAG: hypothetical protein JO021_21090 [Alphaproteobacteria bacterium]|nr:hypothetical protein [Alphaproteobacteria bacterium]